MERDGDIDGALEALVDAVGAQAVQPNLVEWSRPDMPKGDFNPQSIGLSLAYLFPENASLWMKAEPVGAGALLQPEHQRPTIG